MKPNGGLLDSILLFQDYMWRPVTTPFGDLQSKIITVGQRIGHANLGLNESCSHWEEFRSMTVPGMTEVGRTLDQVGNSVLNALGVVPPELPTHAQHLMAPSTAALNQAATVSQTPVPSPGIPERLRELASLHADGILDDAVFAAAKAKLLGNL